MRSTVASVGGPARNAIRRCPSSMQVLGRDLAGVDIVEADMGGPRGQAMALAGLQKRGDWSRAGPFELQRSDRWVEAHDHRGQADPLGESRLGHSRGRRHDDPVDSVAEKDVERPLGAYGVSVPAGDQHRAVLLRRPWLDARCNLGPVRIPDRRYEKPDRPSDPRDEAPGSVIGPVAEPT